MPPRENPRVNKSLDSVHASGPLGRAHCVIHGNSNYKQTGAAAGLCRVLAAAAAAQAGRLRLRLPGVRPSRAARACCAASGWSASLSDRARLSQSRVARTSASPAASGVDHALIDYLDKGASLGADAPCLTMDGRDPSYGEVQAAEPPRRARRCALGRCARRQGRDPVRQRPGRVRLRVRHLAAPARSGARSTRATRRPRTARCSSCSTAGCCCSSRRSRRWSRRIRAELPRLHAVVCLDAESSVRALVRRAGSPALADDQLIDASRSTTSR